MAEKPLLLIVETVSTLGGGERALLQLLPALRQEFEVCVVAPGHGALAEELERLGISQEFLPVGDRYTMVTKTTRDIVSYAMSMPGKTFHLTRCMRRLRPSLLLLNCVPSIPWGTLAGFLLGTPVVWYVHNVLSDAKSVAALKPWSRFPGVRSIIAPSEMAATQFGAPAKAELVEPSVDVTSFAPNPDSRFKIRRELGTPESTLVFASVGELFPGKGHHLAIEAAQKIVADIDLELWVIGSERERSDPDYVHRLRDKASGEARVRLLGYRKDMSSLLAAVDCVLIASATETGPLVMLEALATSVPVISTNVGIASKLLADEACGYLVPVGDVLEMAYRMQQLAKREDRADLGRRGRQRVSEQYSAKSAELKMLSVLKTVLQ